MKFLKKYNIFLEKLFIEDIDEDILKTLNYNKNGNKVYKGVSRINGVFDLSNAIETFLVDPTKTKRTPKGKIYKIIKISKKWNNFHRLKSIICTTNLDDANNFAGFGDVYEVIPTKDEMFICPNKDINYTKSWKYYHEQLSDQSPTLFLDGVFCIIDMFIEKHKKYEYKTNFNYKKIIQLFNENYDKISNIQINDSFINDCEVNGFDFKIAQTSKDILRILKSYNSIQEMIDDLFDPIKNGFKKIKYSDYQKSNEYKDNEVWFNCECVFKEIL